MATLTDTNKYPAQSICSENFVTTIPNYLPTCLLITFQYTCLHTRSNCLVITVNSNRPKSHTSHPLNFHRLYLINFKFMIYLPGQGGSFLCSATPCYPLPPKIIKQTIHQLPIDHIWSISSCISTFPGRVGVVIIKLKANLSSTSHLTSQLELSLAIIRANAKKQ